MKNVVIFCLGMKYSSAPNHEPCTSANFSDSACEQESWFLSKLATRAPTHDSIHQLTKLETNLVISAHWHEFPRNPGQLWFIFCIRPSARHGLRFISGRHMRSKRRCSCVLQFTRLHAVSCVLHRPTSRVIHHSRLIFFSFCYSISIYTFWNFKLHFPK